MNSTTHTALETLMRKKKTEILVKNTATLQTKDAYKLEYIASLLGTSKHAAINELLKAAINDAWLLLKDNPDIDFLSDEEHKIKLKAYTKKHASKSKKKTSVVT